MNIKKLSDTRKPKAPVTPVDQLRALAKSYFEEINYDPPMTTINRREYFCGSYDGALWGIYVESFDHKKFRYYKNWVGLVEDRWDDLSDEWYQSCIDNAKAKEYIEVEAESWAEERDAENQRESW